MKAIKAEYYGCTDLSQVELEQTRGGNPAIWAAIAYAAKKIWDYVNKTSVIVKSPSTTTIVTNGVTNIVQTSGYFYIEHKAD